MATHDELRIGIRGVHKNLEAVGGGNISLGSFGENRSSNNTDDDSSREILYRAVLDPRKSLIHRINLPRLISMLLILM